MNIVLALALGLMFNCGLVLIYEVLRDRLPDTDELEDTLGYPVLASIPTLRLKQLGALAERPASAYERERVLAAQPGATAKQPERAPPT